MLKEAIVASLFSLVASTAWAQCSQSNLITFATGQTASHSDVNSNFSTVLNCANSKVSPSNPAFSGTITAPSATIGNTSMTTYGLSTNGLTVNGSLGVTGGGLTAQNAVLSVWGIQSHSLGPNAQFSANTMSMYWDGACIEEWIDSSEFPLICPSDVRVKSAIASLPDGSGLAVIDKLRPVTFYWANKNSPLNTNRQYGLIAQEVKAVAPDLVYNTGMKTAQTPDGLQRLDYNGLIPILIKAIQEQQAEIAQLKAAAGIQ